MPAADGPLANGLRTCATLYPCDRSLLTNGEPTCACPSAHPLTAERGDPNTAGLPRWPKAGAASDVIVDFTNAGAVARADPLKPCLDMIENSASRAR